MAKITSLTEDWDIHTGDEVEEFIKEQFAGVGTDIATEKANLLQRIQGKSIESRAWDDPFIWLGAFNNTSTDGVVTELGTEAFSRYTRDMLLNTDFLKYTGHGRALVAGTNQDIWTYFMGTRTAEYTDGTYELKFFAQKTRGRYRADALGNLTLSDDRVIMEAERTVTVKRFVDGSPAVIESVTSWVDGGSMVKDLGVFNSTNDILAAAAKFGIVRDSRIAMMVARLNTSNNSHKSSVVINQQVTANGDGTYTTWQYIFEKNKRYTRYIQSNATAVTEVQSTQKDGARNLEYGALGYLKLTNPHGEQVGSSVHLRGIDASALREGNSTADEVHLVQTKTFGNTNEVAITKATSAKAGVMTAEMYNKVTTLETNQNSNSTRIAAVESKQTTDSARITSEVTARTTADTQLLQRIQGRADASSALTDPILYLGEWSNTTNADGTTTYAMDLFDADFEQFLCSNTSRYLGRNRATVWGRNVDLWCYYVGNTEVTEDGNEYDIKTFAIALDSMFAAVDGKLRFDSSYPNGKANRCYKTVKIRYPKNVTTGGTVESRTLWEYTSADVDTKFAVVDIQINSLSEQRTTYTTSELSDISSVGHKANIREISINQSVMGIKLISAVSLMVANDNAHNGLLYLKISDANGNILATSINTVNLSQNLGKHVTWYFAPVQLSADTLYKFAAYDSSNTLQVMRIHVTGGKTEGVTCLDANYYIHQDFTPAFGLNVGSVFAGDLSKQLLSQVDKARNLAYGSLGYMKLTDVNGKQVGESVNMKGIDQSALREENSTTENVRLVQTKTFGGINEVLISPASSTQAGVMTAEMYNKLLSLEARIAALESK